MTTPAEQEAERRYMTPAYKAHFIAGWNECESRYRELLEAAEAYRKARKKKLKGWIAWAELDRVATRLLAAAAALPGGTDAERPPE